MARMIATKSLTYDMKTVEAGAEFEVADQYVQTLVSLGRASLKEGKGTKTEPTTTKSGEEQPDQGKSTYKSRRLKSEDE